MNIFVVFLALISFAWSALFPGPFFTSEEYDVPTADVFLAGTDFNIRFGSSSLSRHRILKSCSKAATMLQRPLLVVLILAAVLNVASVCHRGLLYNRSAQVAGYAIPLNFKTCGQGFAKQLNSGNLWLATHTAAALKQSECSKTTNIAKKVNVPSLRTVGVRFECCMGDRCSTRSDPLRLAGLFERIPVEEIPNPFNKKDYEMEVRQKNGAPEVGVFELFMAVSLASLL
ncbi:hypothetical protein L596_025531 [Steinernema carpocapsae]|uniref:Uncharacterized protein n=1 Tax=Steinernema carpocapsae TaxID=34508 RepID=A0A4U5M814_STECR|nr:hypothetical protein L596_025531 [Steinernema carpocapsae]